MGVITCGAAALLRISKKDRRGNDMDTITIRKAQMADLDQMMEIYAEAKRFMDSTGNTTQWKKGHPTREMIQADVENGCIFVCTGEDNMPHAAFKFLVGEDPTYRVIEQGSWKNDNTYGTIHRVASDGTLKGVFSKMVSFCESICPELRADTHENNHVMQHLLEKNGFERCGIIYIDDGSPRFAYQRCAR